MTLSNLVDVSPAFLNQIPDNCQLRIGIDVGGTFTHGVLLGSNGQIFQHAIVPTTHFANNGIAEGIGFVVAKLLVGINIKQISMVAHSTTQATNAVLEGDLASVELFVLCDPSQTWITKQNFKQPFNISEHQIKTSIHFVTDIHKVDYIPAKLNSNLVVVLQTFADKSTDSENLVADKLREVFTNSIQNLEIIQAGSITRLLGLRVRAATAVLNAAMLPKIQTVSQATIEVIAQQLYNVPINILTSDGGSMPVSELSSRPLAALLSGPAAGAAAATIFSGLTDALFLEVGGTSTDISCIRNGRVELKPAQLGDAMIHMRTLDLHTIALGGGSLVSDKLLCGPRSAHIAGWKYLSFAEPKTVLNIIKWETVKGSKYLAIYDEQNNVFGVTLTDIINWLNTPDRIKQLAKLARIPIAKINAIENLELIPDTDSAYCDPKNPILTKGISLAVELLAGQFNPDDNLIIQYLFKILKKTFTPIEQLLKQILANHGMHRMAGVWLAGGGGGANVVVPWMSLRLRRPYRIVPFARVISAVGAAVALDTSVQEMNVFQPSEEHFATIRAKVATDLAARGIPEDSCEFRVEYDSRTNLLRCTGTGARPAISADANLLVFNEADAARMLHAKGDVIAAHNSELGALYIGETEVPTWFGFHNREKTVLLVDVEGRPRLNLTNCKYLVLDNQNPIVALDNALNQNTTFGDAGAVAPSLWFWDGKRLHDFSGAGDAAATLALVRASLKPDNCAGIVLIKLRY